MQPESRDGKARPDWLAPSLLPRSLQPIFEMRRGLALSISTILIAVLATFDLLVEENVSIGVVFMIPIMLASIHLNRWQVVVVALAASAVREMVAPYAWQDHFESRMISIFVTFLAGGLFASEVGTNRRIVLRSLMEIEEQIHRRSEAEAQLRSLVESSPAAIVTVNSRGEIDLANQAAHSLLLVDSGKLKDRPIAQFLPILSDMLSSGGEATPLRTATSCRGVRANGESFLAYAWFATYPTRTGNRLAAIITDSSEELRDWQQTSLETLLRSTRVLVGSVSHEIRNMCAAIAVANTNIGRLPLVAGSEDYQAMQMLVQGLSRLAAYELQSSSDAEVGTMSVTQLLEEFRIVVDPMLESAGVQLVMETPPQLPLADGDRHGLLQVLLNLTRNSLRVLEELPLPQITLRASLEGDWVYLRFCDNGPGVTDSSRLFQPFQSGADAVGLGLFVSRAIVRGSGGELYHEPTGKGCTMCIRLRSSESAHSPGELDRTELHA